MVVDFRDPETSRWQPRFVVSDPHQRVQTVTHAVKPVSAVKAEKPAKVAQQFEAAFKLRKGRGNAQLSYINQENEYF